MGQQGKLTKTSGHEYGQVSAESASPELSASKFPGRELGCIEARLTTKALHSPLLPNPSPPPPDAITHRH